MKFALPPQGSSCVYEWGFQAFYLTRAMAERLAGVDEHVYCRLPIDMYMATLGPWFASTSNVVDHAGWGRTEIK